jgi:DHA1 family bicyclomycin/chloramphenicol resistance-like MFS transporter
MRFLAAIGGSASMVIPRAIVRDLADGHEAARLMSRLMLVMGAAPILAPTLGGLVLGVTSWHAIFWIAVVYGMICCVLVWFFVPDTLPEQGRVKLGIAALLGRYGQILRERGFLTHALMGGFALFATFAYLGGSPAVFIEHFHLPPPTYGMIFGVCAFGYIAASQVNPALLPRFGASRVLHTSVAVSLIANIALTAIAFAGLGPWWVVAAPILVNNIAQGFTLPNTTVGALSRHAAHAGSASALMGTMQFCLGALSGIIVGLASDGTARPMALLMLLGIAGATVADLCRPKSA